MGARLQRGQLSTKAPKRDFPNRAPSIGGQSGRRSDGAWSSAGAAVSSSAAYTRRSWPLTSVRPWRLRLGLPPEVAEAQPFYPLRRVVTIRSVSPDAIASRIPVILASFSAALMTFVKFARSV